MNNPQAFQNESVKSMNLLHTLASNKMLQQCLQLVLVKSLSAIYQDLPDAAEPTFVIVENCSPVLVHSKLTIIE